MESNTAPKLHRVRRGGTSQSGKYRFR